MSTQWSSRAARATTMGTTRRRTCSSCPCPCPTLPLPPPPHGSRRRQRRQAAGPRGSERRSNRDHSGLRHRRRFRHCSRRLQPHSRIVRRRPHPSRLWGRDISFVSRLHCSVRRTTHHCNITQRDPYSATRTKNKIWRVCSGRGGSVDGVFAVCERRASPVFPSSRVPLIYRFVMRPRGAR